MNTTSSMAQLVAADRRAATNSRHRTTTPSLRTQLHGYNQLLKRYHKGLRELPADSAALLMWSEDVAEAATKIRADHGDDFDLAFRAALIAGGKIELPHRRALGASAYNSVAGRSFVETFQAAMANPAPLVDLATKVDTSHGGFVDFSFVADELSAGDVVAQGGTISASDPAFDGADMATYAYKRMLEMSAEVATDAAFDAETFTTILTAPFIGADLNADCWDGDGSSKPLGLLAGLSTVAAAGAAIVTFDDVAALLNGVPSMYRYSGRCHVLLSPGAHIDLIEEQPLHDWASGTIHGFPFRVDAALADPATTAKSAAAGDFQSAYAVRRLPLRIDTDSDSGFASDKVRVKVVLRADGKRMITDAARALVHP